MLTSGERFRVLEKCGFRCVYCGRSARDVELQVDHVHPVALGGSDDEHNLVAACVDCNSGKRARPGVSPPRENDGEVQTIHGQPVSIGYNDEVGYYVIVSFVDHVEVFGFHDAERFADRLLRAAHEAADVKRRE